MRTYNVQINPELASLDLGYAKLVHTQHAKKRSLERGIELPQTLKLGAGSVVELEAEGRKIKKVVVRFRMTEQLDAVYVLWNQFGDLWTVLSCYTNSVNDNHSTLRLGRVA